MSPEASTGAIDGEPMAASLMGRTDEGGVAAGEKDEVGGGGGSGTTTGKKRQNFLRTLWEFSRPHTMIGTALAIPAMGAFAAPPGMERVSC